MQLQEKLFVIFCIIILSIDQSQQASPSDGNKASKQNDSQNNTVEDILQDTFQLLDVLDQKLASVKNRTPSAMMRDNLRALTTFNTNEPPGINQKAPNQPQQAPPKRLPTSLRRLDDNLDDSEMTQLAEAFSSDRKTLDGQRAARETDAMMTAPSESNYASLFNRNNNNNNNNNNHNNNENDNSQSSLMRRNSRQLISDEANHLAENDFTERHIKFTLDLMQATFVSQSFNSKTNLIESFLISPLSIQMVLMMMHLGARGQTRREINQCLNLPLNSAASSSSSSSTASSSSTSPSSSTLLHQTDLQAELTAANAKLKRRHQASNKSTNSPISRHSSSQQQQQQQQQQSTSQSGAPSNAHELFGAAMRNLLKDPIVVKALTSANQIFVQKNLPLAPQFEWALRHYYGTDIKQVDFQHQHQHQQQQQQSTSSAANDKLAGNGNSAKPSPDYGATSATNATTNNNANNNEQQQQQLKGQQRQNEEVSANNIQQLINDWIERQTKGRISNFLASPVPTSTLLMAINVLYFKGDWQYKFDSTDTEPDATFTQTNGKTVKIPMMVNKLPLAFAHDSYMKTSVIELPYKAQRLGLFLLLPDETSGIFHTMQSLNSTSFANLISSMRKSSSTPNEAGGINVRIPKFSIESTPRLSQILSQQLGLKSLFMPDVADLSGMFAGGNGKRSTNSTMWTNGNNGHHATSEQQTNHQAPPQVGLDELLHKAVLQVDEQGSVAAASSATIVERVGLFNGNYFEADHPFLLFLMDKQTGMVLFSGVFAGNNQQQQQQSSTAYQYNNNSNSNTTSTTNSSTPANDVKPQQRQ